MHWIVGKSGCWVAVERNDKDEIPRRDRFRRHRFAPPIMATQYRRSCNSGNACRLCIGWLMIDNLNIMSSEILKWNFEKLLLWPVENTPDKEKVPSGARCKARYTHVGREYLLVTTFSARACCFHDKRPKRTKFYGKPVSLKPKNHREICSNTHKNDCCTGRVMQFELIRPNTASNYFSICQRIL